MPIFSQCHCSSRKNVAMLVFKNYKIVCFLGIIFGEFIKFFDISSPWYSVRFRLFRRVLQMSSPYLCFFTSISVLSLLFYYQIPFLSNIGVHISDVIHSFFTLFLYLSKIPLHYTTFHWCSFHHVRSLVQKSRSSVRSDDTFINLK